MREILFRGIWGFNDEWVEGFYYQAKLYRTDKELCNYITIPHPESDGQPSDHIMVHPETVGQFTGLTDKNEKKIFEGDIVLYPWNDQDKPERFTIKFKYGQFVASPVKETEDYWDFMVGCYSKEMEIIGNIHDNPELLENP